MGPLTYPFHCWARYSTPWDTHPGMPLLYTLWYIRLPPMYPGGVPRSAVSVTKKVLVADDSSVRVVEGARLCREECVPFHLRNKPSWARKPPLLWPRIPLQKAPAHKDDQNLKTPPQL